MKRYVIVFILTVVSTFLIHTGLISIGLFPVEASTQSIVVDQLFHVHLWMISFLFSLIMVTLVYSLIAFHRKKGEAGEGAYLTGNSTLEVSWTAIPLVAVLVLAYAGAKTLGSIQLIDPTALKVQVTAGQWYWQFAYPDYGVTSTDLYLPVNIQVDLQMTSVDVIHSFWVPEFRVKQDIIPGRTVDMRVTPSLIGNYTVRCAELCGLRHAYMETGVKVVSQADFASWIAKQQSAAPPSPELRGQQLATAFGCINCHSIDGSKKTGPTWLHLYESNVKLSDGSTAVVDDDYLKTAIISANTQITAGFPSNVMPDFSTVLDQTMVEALVAYIKTLK
ncbi:MAG: cytochrome c oxidase subunit II [Acidobacteriaceae bacterium]